MHRWLSSLGLGVVIGCGGAAPTPPTVRDSAGVTIVENYGPQWPRGSEWKVSDQPLVDVGGAGADPMSTLSRPIGAVRLQDGSIVVADAGTQELRWYDAGGDHLRTLGGRGVGTGHFASLDWIGLSASGNLVAFDFGRLRVAEFDMDGGLLRTVSLVITYQMEPGSVRGVSSDSSFVLIRDVRHWARSMTQSGNTPDGLIRGPASVSRFSPEGSYVGDIGTFAGAERIFTRGRQRLVRISGRPFGKAAVFDVANDMLYAGTQDDYCIELRDLSGVTTSIIRLQADNQPVTQQYIDRYIRGRLANVHERERADKQAEIAALPYPDYMPAYGQILVDESGNLWVADYRPFGEGEPSWNVFDTNHHLLGSVVMPDDLAIYQIGSNYVLGGFQDEEGAQHVRTYELKKPAGQ